MATLGGPNIVQNGLVLELDAGNVKSYPRTGTIWYDKSGNGYYGTFINNPTFSSASLGNIIFSGTNYISGSSTAAVTNNLTIEAFIYPTSYPNGAGGGAFIISNLGYYLELKNSGVLRSYFYGLSTAGYHDGTMVISLNTWNQVVVVRNQSDNTIKHYVNATLDNIISNITGNITSAPGGLKNYQIGKYSGDNSYSFIGGILNLKVYNKALSSAEIRQNYNALKSRFL